MEQILILDNLIKYGAAHQRLQIDIFNAVILEIKAHDVILYY